MTELDKLIFDIAAAKELVTVNKGYYGTTYGPSAWDLKILDLLEQLAKQIQQPDNQGDPVSVDVVARAIFSADTAGKGTCSNEGEREHYRVLARAAIDALK